MVTHSSILAWRTHGWRSLVGYSSQGRKESDTTERLHFTSLSVGERRYPGATLCCDQGGLSKGELCSIASQLCELR